MSYVTRKLVISLVIWSGMLVGMIGLVFIGQPFRLVNFEEYIPFGVMAVLAMLGTVSIEALGVYAVGYWSPGRARATSRWTIAEITPALNGNERVPVFDDHIGPQPFNTRSHLKPSQPIIGASDTPNVHL